MTPRSPTSNVEPTMTSPTINTYRQAEAAAVAELARQTLQPDRLDLGRYYVVPTSDGQVVQIDLTGDEYLDAPLRKRGTTTVRDAASFLAYWAKHSDDASEVYADRDARTITGVLDAHFANAPRFGAHRLVLKLRHSESFLAWQAISGKPQNQLQLAEFIEDHRPDIRKPSAAELLEMATTFQATTRASFKSATVLQSGQRVLEYAETIDASSGAKGRLPIPEALELALQVFEGSPVADTVTARLRYRISDGRLVLIVILDRLAEVVDAAFEGVIREVQDGIGEIPVLRGSPA